MLSLRSSLSGGSWLLLFAALASGAGCASEEIPKYGDPSRVAGGVGGGAGTSGTAAGGEAGASGSTPGQCTVDASCAVSFKNDIFPVLDATPTQCSTKSLCHGAGGDKDGLSLTEGDVADYYKALTEYVVPDPPGPAGKYIVPCYPEQSQLPCNLSIRDGDMKNPHPLCGKTMPPKVTNGITKADLQKIEDWITCGAPNN